MRREVGLGGDSVDRFVLAVHEAAANIVRHALGQCTCATFRVAVERTTRHATARLIHCGPPFDPSTATPPTFDDTREDGFGLYLIEICVDSVTYDRDDEGLSRINLSINLD